MKATLKELIAKVLRQLYGANLIDQSAGKTAKIYFGNCNRTTNGVVCYCHIPFPFTTKNTDYLVAYPSAISVSNVGSVTVQAVAIKATTGVVLQLATTDCNNLVWGTPEITITFA